MCIAQTQTIPEFTASNCRITDFPRSNIAKSLLYDVAISTFKDIALTAAMTTLTCCFVASYSIPFFITSAITLVTVNVLVRLAGALSLYKLHQLEQQDQLQNEIAVKCLKISFKITQWVYPCTFAILDDTTTSVLVHEAGHALAVLSVYQKSKPTIKIFPGSEGLTRYFEGPLTKFGSFLGAKNSDILVTAAGPAFGIISATIQIIFSHKLQKDHPEASKMLLVAAITNIGSHAMYALSALWMTRKNPSHDFLYLWSAAQIHPVTSVVTMVALPIIVKIILVVTTTK